MRIEELCDGLKSTGLELAYFQFEENEAPELPYLVYYFPADSDFFADSKNYQKVCGLNVELYTKEKDFETEALVESALTDLGLSFARSEHYWKEEQCYEVLFEMEVLING